MKNVALTLVLLALPAVLPAAGTFADDAAFATIETRYVREFLKRHPVVSTYLGGSGLYPELARADARLREWSPTAREEDSAVWLEVRAALQQLQPERLSPRRRVDREVALHQIDFMLRQDLERKHWQRALDTYVSEPFRGIDWSMQGMTTHRDGTLGTQREWALVAGRLAAVPIYLTHARANLEAGIAAGNTPDWRMVESEIASIEANARYFEAELPAAVVARTKGQAFSAASVAEVTRNGAAAARAFRELGAFVQQRLATLPRQDRYAFGEKEYDWALRNNLNLQQTAAELHERSWPIVESTRAALVDTARKAAEKNGLKLSWDPKDRDTSTRAVIDVLAKDHPESDAEMVRWYHQAALRLVEFARKHQMFDIPAEYALEVHTTPPALESSIDGAAYYPAPPFKDAGIGRFYITATRGDVELLKQNNRAAIADLAAHEGFPGHDWHFKLLTKYRDRISPIRWLTPGEVEGSSAMWQDSMATEGWGLYAESLMAEPQPGAPDGFYTPEELIYQLHGQLYRDLRVRIDTGLHTGRLSFDDAVDLYSTVVDFLPGSCRVPQPRPETQAPLTPEKRASCDAAQRAIRRYAKWPTQAITYHLGRARILDLRRRAEALVPGPAGRKLFHDLFVQQGLIPPGYFEEQLLADMKGAR